MVHYPFITLDKVEIPRDNIFGVDNGWDNPCDPAQTWRELSQKQEVLDYLKSLQDRVGQTLKPTELLPPWKANGYFKFAHPVPGTSDYLGKYYLAFEDELPFQEKTDGICHLAVLENGPNFGSAGGPTLMTVGVIATFYYTPKLNP